MQNILPNALTWLRIFAAFAPIFTLGISAEDASSVAVSVLAIAAITDFLDGKLARAWNVTSRLGQVLDSIADKMILASLIMLSVSYGLLGPIGIAIAILLILREIWIGGLREGLGQSSSLLSATNVAKWKTVLQFLGLLVIFANSAFEFGLEFFCDLALLPALVLSLVSAWDYSRRGLAALANQDASQ